MKVEPGRFIGTHAQGDASEWRWITHTQNRNGKWEMLKKTDEKEGKQEKVLKKRRQVHWFTQLPSMVPAQDAALPFGQEKGTNAEHRPTHNPMHGKQNTNGESMKRSHEIVAGKENMTIESSFYVHHDAANPILYFHPDM